MKAQSSVLFIALPLVALIFMTSCQQEKLTASFGEEVGNEEAQFRLAESGYEVSVEEALEQPGDYDLRTAGTISYAIDGEVVARVEFGDGERDEVAHLLKDGERTALEMRKKEGKDKEGKFEYDKYIVEPLVKGEGCDYITSGTIKYYKDKEWVATVDYGDGTCDEWAVKTTKEGEENFSLEDWK